MNEKAASEIWGESESFLAAKERLSRAAKVNRPVLIFGERGTGKELAAARIHYLSPRWKGPYLTLNCAALNPNLVESELFGYEPGAFTGAARVSPGRFEAADGGTLFLDEISHLSLEAQAKILRVVEYGSFQRLGSPRERQVDVRLVSATNVDLKARAAAGTFLPDLLDRLSFEVITLPPLRERGSDILLLAHLFAARMAVEMELDQTPFFSPEAIEALESHLWPGNIRELKNAVERAVYRGQGPVIEAGDLELDSAPLFPLPAPSLQITSSVPESRQAAAGPGPLWPLAEGEFDALVASYALEIFDQALRKTEYNQKKAAEILGLTYHRFRFLHRKYQSARDGEQPDGATAV
ncbi:AAA family ATPase [Deltaproteobacteria bacterium Smac51]|nr:AAA family ATPase [Deltaproteobacteria bacterium Smac51]